MTQCKLTVEHPGTHNPTREQISNALSYELKDRGLKRAANADFTVKGYSVTSGGPSEFTVEVDTEPVAGSDEPAPTPKKAAAPKAQD